MSRNHDAMLMYIQAGLIRVNVEGDKVWLHYTAPGRSVPRLANQWIQQENQYYCVSVFQQKKAWCFTTHRLVWTFFNGRIPDHLQIDHINRVRLDNRLCNLRLVTPKGNMENREMLKGTASPYAKLTEESLVSFYERRLGGATQQELAAEFNVHLSTVQKTIYGQKGYPSLKEYIAGRRT